MSLLKATQKRVQRDHNKDAIKSVQKEETKRLNVDVPLSLHRKFKSLASLEEGDENGNSGMTALILKWVNEYVEKNTRR